MEDRINQIVAKLRDHDVEKIVLFGSAARGQSDDKSDVDLLIIKRTRKRFLDRLKEVMRILRPDYSLDVLVYTPSELRKMLKEENPFIQQVMRDGIVLYEKPPSRGKALAGPG
ncbi:MAG: nucleotidyltransferase domain-containing protein [bacterium]